MGLKTSKQINKDINNILSNYLCNDLCKVVLEYFDDINFSNIHELPKHFINEINKLYIDCSEREGCKLNIRHDILYLVCNKPYVICNNAKHLKLFKCSFDFPDCLGIIRSEKVMYKYGLYMCCNCFVRV